MGNWEAESENGKSIYTWFVTSHGLYYQRFCTDFDINFAIFTKTLQIIVNQLDKSMVISS